MKNFFGLCIIKNITKRVAPSHKRVVKSAASRLTLTVVVELSNAARAASTVRVILPTLLFLRATISFLHLQ